MDDWEVLLGYCINKGIGDPRELYVDQFTSLMWFLLTEGKEEHELERLRGQLWIPPEGEEIDARSPWHPDNQLKNLQRVKAGKPAGS